MVGFRAVRLLVVAGLMAGGTVSASAVEVRVSARALERTLRAQLFTGPEARYYLRGDARSACYVYAAEPHVSFREERIVVEVKTRAKLGTPVHGSCLGVSMSDRAVVSLVPEAEGESVGFREARMEQLSANRELNFLLVPFLNDKLPRELKVNAAQLMRTLLAGSAEKTGYVLSLGSLKLHSLLVEKGSLVLDVDAVMAVD